jgi:ubiquinone biosynthesis protein COQ4
MVAALGETTGKAALVRMRRRMLLDPVGRKILRNRPIVHSSTIEMDRLGKLSSETFGNSYYRFLKNHNITSDSRVEVQYIDDPELAYVMTRYRQVHDFWHTLTQLPTNVEAEVGLKLFELFQTGLPMNALAVAFGPLALNSEERSTLFNQYIPWAITCGGTSKDLMNVMYEDHFDEPLDKLQSILKIKPFKTTAFAP